MLPLNSGQTTRPTGFLNPIGMGPIFRRENPQMALTRSLVLMILMPLLEPFG